MRELRPHVLVAEEVDLAVESDAPGQRFARVMQEGRPPHRGTRWGLAHDANRVIPEIFLAAEPWRDVRLGLGGEWLDLGERGVQQAGAAQNIESVIDVLGE